MRSPWTRIAPSRMRPNSARPRPRRGTGPRSVSSSEQPVISQSGKGGAPILTRTVPKNYWCGQRSFHWNFHAGLARDLDGFRVAGVDVAGDADARIVGEDALDARGHFLRPVGDQHLPRVQRVANADSAAVMNRNPARAARGVEERIKQRPI